MASHEQLSFLVLVGFFTIANAVDCYEMKFCLSEYLGKDFSGPTASCIGSFLPIDAPCSCNKGMLEEMNAADLKCCNSPIAAGCTTQAIAMNCSSDTQDMVKEFTVLEGLNAASYASKRCWMYEETVEILTDTPQGPLDQSKAAAIWAKKQHTPTSAKHTQSEHGTSWMRALMLFAVAGCGAGTILTAMAVHWVRGRTYPNIGQPLILG